MRAPSPSHPVVRMGAANPSGGQVPVVFAVDNYQALHAPSTYGEKRTEFSRRQLDPGELRVASLMRVLDGPPPAWGVDVAALTWSEGYHAEQHLVSLYLQGTGSLWQQPDPSELHTVLLMCVLDGPPSLGRGCGRALTWPGKSSYAERKQVTA